MHEVVNDALEPAVSLHVYFPGLTEMPMHPHAGGPPPRAALAAAYASVRPVATALTSALRLTAACTDCAPCALWFWQAASAAPGSCAV